MLTKNILPDLERITREFQNMQRAINNANAALRAMGTATSRAAGAAKDFTAATTGLGKAMPEATKQAEATAKAMERAASASRALVLYQSGSTGFTLQGRPYTPYGASPSLPGPRPGMSVVPWAGPTGFTMGPGGPSVTAGVPPPSPPGWGTYGAPAGQGGALVPGGAGGAGGGGMPPLNYSPNGVPGGGGPTVNGTISGAYKMMLIRDILEEVWGIVTAPVKEAMKADDQMVRLQMGGVDEADRAEVEAMAHKLADRLPRTYADIIQDFRHLRGNLGENHSANPNSDALRLFPQIEESAVVLHKITNEDINAAMMRLMKIADLGGDLTDPQTHEINPERFFRGIDAAIRAIATTNGLAGTPDFYNLMKQAGPALRMITDPEARYASILAPLIDVGGARTGTGLTAGMRQFIGGAAAKHYFEEMQELGLVKPGEPWNYLTPFHGRNMPVQLDKGAINEDQMKIIQEQGFFAWSQQVLKRRLDEKGITNASDINRETYRLFSTETFRRIMSIYLTQSAQVMRDAEMMGKVPHVQDQLKILQENSLSMSGDALSASIANWLSRMGANMKPVARGAMDFGTYLFNMPSGLDMASQAQQRMLQMYWGADTATMLHGADAHEGHPYYRTGAPNTLLHFKDQWAPDEHKFNESASMKEEQHSWLDGLSHTISEAFAGVAKAEGSRPINVSINMDGKLIARSVGKILGDQANLPSSSPTGTDTRSTPPQPGDPMTP